MQREGVMFYYEIEPLKTEAANKTVLRTRGINGPDYLMIDDQTDITSYLKKAADEVYKKIQTLSDKYEFNGKNMNYTIEVDEKKRQVMYTLIKDYLVEGVMKGWFEDNAYMEGMTLCQLKQDKMMEDLQSLRLRPVTKKYFGI